MAEPRTDREQPTETKESPSNRQMTTTRDHGSQQGAQQLRRRSAVDNPFGSSQVREISVQGRPERLPTPERLQFT